MRDSATPFYLHLIYHEHPSQNNPQYGFICILYSIHPTDGHSSCFQFIYFNNPEINILTHRSLHADVFISVRQDPKYGIVGSKGRHVPNFHQNCLHSPQAAAIHFPAKSQRVAPSHTSNRGCYQPLKCRSTGQAEN